MRSVNPNTGIKGFDIVLANLNKEIRAIEGRSVQGLLKGAAKIRYEMDHTPPLIPIKSGVMRSSWYAYPIVSTGVIGGGPLVRCGFSANYALWPHEMLNPDINWTRPNSGPKFFEYAVKRNTGEILKIIRDNVNIKI
jgi:hypothetical protein